MSHPLDTVNLTELVQIARDAGLGNYGRNTPREVLYGLLDEEEKIDACPLEEKRHKLEAHIQKYFRRLRTQLPCPYGKCVSYGCPDIVVQMCWEGHRREMI